MWNEYLTKLRDLLAEKINHKGDIERILDDAGLSRKRITIDEKVINIWHSALSEAVKVNKEGDLLAVAFAEAPSLVLAQSWLDYILDKAPTSKDEAQSLFWQSCHHPIEGHFEVNSLHDAAKYLWDIPDPDGRHLYIVEYVERLAIYVADFRVGGRLNQWSEQVVCCQDLRITADELSQIRLQLALQQVSQAVKSTARSYLLVEISPDPFSRKGNIHRRFNLKVSYWKNEEEINRWDDQIVHESYRLEQIPQQLYELLKQNSHEKPSMLELFLPYELLTHHVDQWEFHIKDIVTRQTIFLRKLCAEYEIVIRSLERSSNLSGGLTQQKWHEKWEALYQHRERCKTHWLHGEDEPSVQQLFDELLDADEPAVCVGFTYVPSSSGKGVRKNDLLITILSAGIPLMLWSRKAQLPHIDPIVIRQELESLLCDENLPNLSNEVHKVRNHKDARSNPDHLGNHLALFCDDPNRLPIPLNRNHSAL